MVWSDHGSVTVRLMELRLNRQRGSIHKSLAIPSAKMLTLHTNTGNLHHRTCNYLTKHKMNFPEILFPQSFSPEVLAGKITSSTQSTKPVKDRLRGFPSHLDADLCWTRADIEPEQYLIQLSEKDIVAIENAMDGFKSRTQPFASGTGIESLTYSTRLGTATTRSRTVYLRPAR